MPDEPTTEQTVGEQPQPAKLPELQRQAPVSAPPLKKKRWIKERDCLEWIEFGAAMLEVALTITITILIVYELFYARHQDWMASRAPEITFYQNSLPFVVLPRDIDLPPREFVISEIGIIFNQGHAALLNGSVVAFTDQQDVKITCAEKTVPCRTHYEPGLVFPGVDFDFGTLAVRRGVEIKFALAYMSTHKPFKVRISVSGDNIEPSKLADLQIGPAQGTAPDK